MRIRVDPEKCQGHNRCKAVAPELFELDRFGNASAAGDGHVPPEFEEKARLAVANCPEMAVEIVEDGSGRAPMAPRKPVTDWATDWDHLDPRWREDPFPIWDELR